MQTHNKHSTSRNIIALIVAGGTGNRFGSDIPKQYLPLGGISILRMTVMAYLTHPRVSSVQVVIGPEHFEPYRQSVKGLDLPSPVIGGDTRAQSVLNGLNQIQSRFTDADSALECAVLVHDGARPLIDEATITRVIDAIAPGQGAVAALPVHDTVRRTTPDGLALTEQIDRTNLWRMQTPQGFLLGDLLPACQKTCENAPTDEAAAALAMGMDVRVVHGGRRNLKITRPEDLELAENMMGYTDIRTGMGFDVHAFTSGDHVTICGIKIPHTHSLAGHSDADVGLHALTDAILGAIGKGDIGQHFPPSDPKWKGADSRIFIENSMLMLRENGGMLLNCDVTIICETPKMGPYREIMITKLSELLGVEGGRINIKATTTEQLGFTGRKEGIAAQACATVRLPG